MMARSTNAPFTGRIQKRKTNPLRHSHPACNTRPARLPLCIRLQTYRCVALSDAVCHKPTKCSATKYRLFDHLVSDGEHCSRNSDAESLRGLEIDR